MRRTSLLIIILLSVLTVQAQEARLAQIRKLYAEAKESMENRKTFYITTPIYYPNDMVVSSNYMAPGAGPIKDVTHYYYQGEYDDQAETVVYTPYFITRKYNVGARDYYEEFLFEKGGLVFYFCKSEKDETRYYWGPNGFFHELIKGQRLMDDAFATRLACDLKEAFDKLMNRNY